MNTFRAKKIGEVLAFENVSLDTLEKAKGGFLGVFDQEQIDDIKQKNQKNIDDINGLDVAGEVKEAILTKAEKTGEKLKKMRDMYIGDEWNDSAEVLEWSGFFEGSAIVHWNLVDGLALSDDHQDLKTITDQALKLHRELFELVGEKLREVGINKSKE